MFLLSSLAMSEEVDKEDGPPKKTREDYKKQKELDEARKSGLEPAEQDEFGVDINPHIPQYIKDSPWYLQMEGYVCLNKM